MSTSNFKHDDVAAALDGAGALAAALAARQETGAVHRVPAGTRRARQVAAATGRVDRGHGLSPEVCEHNARLEAARVADLERRQRRRRER